MLLPPVASVRYKFRPKFLFRGDGIVGAGSWADLPARASAIAASQMAGNLTGLSTLEALMNALLIQLFSPLREMTSESVRQVIKCRLHLQLTELAIHAGSGACHALAQKCQIRSAATIKASFLVGGMTGFAVKLPLKAGASRARY